MAKTFLISFDPMFYKWVKRLLWLAIVVSLVSAIGLAAGWIGLKQVPLVVQLFLLTIGLFVFYQTRKGRVNQAWLSLPLLVAHVLALPVAILLVIAVKNEQFAHNYWFMANMAMVVLVGLVWLALLAGLRLPVLAKGALMLLSAAYTVLLCIQMAGMFGNGQVIFFSGIFIFLLNIAVILLVIRKPVVPEAPAPTVE
jgi:hypothetical protein